MTCNFRSEVTYVYELLFPYSIRLLLLVTIILCNIYATLHDSYLRNNYSNYVILYRNEVMPI